MSEQITTIDLLRHGACEGGRIFRGSHDAKLSQDGFEQMQRAFASVYSNQSCDRVITSPLQRCNHFAEYLAHQFSMPISIEHDFREMHFGDWEGQLIVDVWQNDRQRVQRFFDSPMDFSPPNGESMLSFKQRLLAAWERVLDRYSGQHLLLIQHGGTIRVLLAYILQMPLNAVTRFEVPYASLSRILVYPQGLETRPVLLFHNICHSHNA